LNFESEESYVLNIYVTCYEKTYHIADYSE